LTSKISQINISVIRVKATGDNEARNFMAWLICSIGIS